MTATDKNSYSIALEFAPEWDDELFTMTPTVWARLSLHWEDMGFLFWLRSHRKGFRFSETYMVGATPGGRDKVRAIMRRLEKAGIIKRRKERDASGRITGTTFIVPYPTLRTPGQRPENPSVDADQGIRGESPGETSDGFSVDGKAVRGPRPAEIDDPECHPSTEKPSEVNDLHKRTKPQVKPATEKPSLDSTSEDPVNAQVGTYDGFTGDGKSATKKDQYKGKSSGEGKLLLRAAGTTDREPAPAVAEPDGSGISSGSSLEEGHAAVALLRDAVDPAAARRLTAREVDRLVGRVAGLLEGGVHAAELRDQLAPVTSPTTTHPFTRLSRRLDEITGEGNPLTAPAPGGASGVVIRDGDRQLTYRSCGRRDCTGGGNGAVGRGGGTWRRRIDPDTGAATELCDRPVTTPSGQTVTCHPDAALTTAGGALCATRTSAPSWPTRPSSTRPSRPTSSPPRTGPTCCAASTPRWPTPAPPSGRSPTVSAASAPPPSETRCCRWPSTRASGTGPHW